jgi:hypothetical protein
MRARASSSVNSPESGAARPAQRGLPPMEILAWTAKSISAAWAGSAGIEKRCADLAPAKAALAAAKAAAKSTICPVRRWMPVLTPPSWPARAEPFGGQRV